MNKVLTLWWNLHVIFYEKPVLQAIFNKRFQVFSCEICEIFENIFLQSTSGDCFWILASELFWAVLLHQSKEKKLPVTASEF